MTACPGEPPLINTSLQLWGQETVATRIAPQTGYVREACSDHSFTGYLRNLPLMPKGSKVMLYNGKEKSEQASLTYPVGGAILVATVSCPHNCRDVQSNPIYISKYFITLLFIFCSGQI